MLSLSLMVAAIGCDVEQTREGELPSVEVDPGALPEYDVGAPDVDVSMKDAEVSVPDVDVEMEEKDVQVPDVDITLPEDE